MPMYDKLDLTKSSSVSIMSASFKKKGIALNRRGARKVVRTSSAPDGRGKPSLQFHGYQGYAGGKNRFIVLTELHTQKVVLLF